jgi:hypothetical protein
MQVQAFIPERSIKRLNMVTVGWLAGPAEVILTIRSHCLWIGIRERRWAAMRLNTAMTCSLLSHCPTLMASDSLLNTTTIVSAGNFMPLTR